MAVYYFFNDGSGDTSWINAANWWLDDSHITPVGSFPTIDPADTVYVDSDVGFDFDNNIAYKLTNFSTVYTSSSLYVANDMINNGIFVTDLDFTLDGSATLTNNGTLNMNGETYINGNIVNTQEASFSFTFVILGIFTNSTSNSILNLYYDGICSGTIINNGTVECGNVLPNTGTITNNGLFRVGGTLTNRNTITNNGTFTVTSLGALCITPASTFTNFGTYNFGTTYSTKVVGSIYPQVPSSMAFGGAIIGAIF